MPTLSQPVDLSLNTRLTVEESISDHLASDDFDMALPTQSKDFARDVLEGLSASPKRLSPRYFYDETGSKLFEDICNLPEYYVTRTEYSIFRRFAPEIAGRSEGNMGLIELGSGSSRKTCLLIEALISLQGHLHYFPIDISESILVPSANDLLKKYPELKITAHVAEYDAGIRRIGAGDFAQKLVIFLGSNIGNFEPHEAVDFLRKIRRELRAHDYFLLGTDMQKEVSVLESAYDDAQGVTAAFNLNLLHRINRELAGDFNVSRFSHVAFYNVAQSRIEMHLRSEVDQEVHIGQLRKTFPFAKGETIHTENSDKYSIAQINEMGSQAGFHVVQRWQDERGYFCVNLLAPTTSG